MDPAPVSRIHYLIHPLYAIDDQREETVGLIDRILAESFSWRWFPNQLVILDLAGPDGALQRVRRVDIDEYRQALHDYYAQAARLVRELTTGGTPFFHGVPFELVPRRGYRFSPEFREFATAFTPDHQQDITVVGHGAYNGSCVQTRSENLAEAVRFEWGMQPAFELGVVLPDERKR